MDYPKHGYSNWNSYLKQILRRVNTEVNDETSKEVIQFVDRSFVIYSAVHEFLKAIIDEFSLKTAIVTTIAKFRFLKYIKPISVYIDFVTTEFEARCEKSNPKIYIEALKQLGVKPKETVMIEDDVITEIIVPKRVGVHTIFLDRAGNQEKPELANAKVNTLTEAINVIKKVSLSFSEFVNIAPVC